MNKTLHRGDYTITISSKKNSNRTFEVSILGIDPYENQIIGKKKCVCFGALDEIERWFDKEENVIQTLGCGARKFCFELVPC